MKKKIYILFTIIGLSQNIICQNNNKNQFDTENVFLTSNNSIFVVGETLLYNFNSLNSITNLHSNISKIGHVQLINSKKEIVVDQKLFLNNGICGGDIFISPKFNSGTYKLVAFTNWSLNNYENSFFEKDVLIINQFQNVDPEYLNNIKIDSNYNNKEIRLAQKNDNLSILLNRKTFSKREAVIFKLIKNNENLKFNNLTISVHKVSLNSNKNNSSLFSKKNTSINLNNNSNLVLPEFRGEIISGKIISKENSEVRNKIISLSISGSSFFVTNTTTNSNGDFYFTIDKKYNKPEILIQVVDDKKESFEIILNKNPQIDFSKLKEFKNFSLNEISEFRERAIQSQLENAFYEAKKDSIINNKSNDLFSKPNVIYKLDDYKRFSNLKEVIVEIVKEVVFEENEKEKTLKVLNLNNQIELSRPTLILVDGIELQNLEDLITYNMNMIDKIEVITDAYIFHSNFYNGVINFYTKNGNFNLKANGKNNIIKKIETPLALKKYFEPNYQKENLKNIPDFRRQLKWITNYNQSDDEEIQFYTSDLIGTFEIKVEGLLNNELFTITDFIEVK
ncbi:hypothetical protein [Flavobacterium sp.]|uniref:hypothetical protein n=1 Tax=Flavobacterium sp. TaxID=239 RepID=UPI002613EA19|nr:hypothetical protein [Flavobacterium sp.]